MEQYDEIDTFKKVESWPTVKRVESWPTIEEIERRLRKLGCTKEQVKRHLDQVAISRIEAARGKLKPLSKGRSPIPKDQRTATRSAS